MKVTKILILILAAVACSPQETSKYTVPQADYSESIRPWRALFDSETLDGWKVLNGTAPYRVEDDQIVGTTKADTPNTFLVTEKDYGDFIFEFEVKVDSTMNSGVQFRSLSDPDYMDGRVHGYQCEIDPSDRAWSGGIYDEARRGWLYDLENNPEGQQAFVNGEWNRYRIEALGSNLRVWVNDINTANLVDTVTATGFIGLQVHAIGEDDTPGKEVRWRNLRILTEDINEYIWDDRVTAPLVNTKDLDLDEN